MCGAINTVINDHGVLTGTITDGTGYMTALKDQGIDIIGKKMTIVGAGGAATAIVMQAALDGVKELIVSDVIYMPEKTKLLEEAEKIGCKTINGLGMMLYQGAASFKLWTDQDMPIDVVKEALDF